MYKYIICISFIMGNMPTFAQYSMPPEWHPHAGTWLQWPHDNTYYSGYRDFFESAWIEITLALDESEQVYIVAYDTSELTHISEVLVDAGAFLDSIQFFVFLNNDYWVRDNGPIYVFDSTGQLSITDWGFDGWGNDAEFELCDVVPTSIGLHTAVPVIDLSAYTLEGGAVEHDGQGTFIGTISSIMGDGRNPGLTTDDMEIVMNQYLGFEQFIWLEGAYGGSYDVTDSHIDGFLRFADEETIITMEEDDLQYWYVNADDRSLIMNAQDVSGNPYEYIFLPLTKQQVKTTDGVSTGSKGSYVNFYEANSVVLVPIYEDDHDSLAISILQDFYTDKNVIGIDCRNMFSWGGMVHCVTQQIPRVLEISTMTHNPGVPFNLRIQPNPSSNYVYVETPVQSGWLRMHDMQGRLMLESTVMEKGTTLNVNGFSPGRYFVSWYYHDMLVRASVVIQP
jgi:agmatine deiminase